MLDVYLAFQPPDGMTPPPEADFVIRPADAAARFPTRHAEHQALQRGTPWGYTDLIWVMIYLSDRLASCDRFWLVEFDVDFSGDWGNFFRQAAPYDEDLLVTRLRPLSTDPRYKHVRDYRQPAHAVADPLIGFFPISRLSRALAERYPDLVADPGWQGHFEMVLPTAAASAGFSVADLGGDGPLTPPARRGRHYSAAYTEADRSGSFVFRPARALHYFDERPGGFARADWLYHPVKVDLPFRQWLKVREQMLRYWWFRQRDRLIRLRARLLNRA